MRRYAIPELLLRPLVLVCSLMLMSQMACSQEGQVAEIKTGSMRTELYMPLLKGKRVGVVANQTSTVGPVHIVDSLLRSGIDVVKVFSPEHGFRGDAAAGARVDNSVDPATGLPIISLYGANKKPSPASLKDIDILLFDLQDVGVRFYTYISTLHYVMEACAEGSVPVMVLDRPNPNGFYVDGPILQPAQKSFVGMHPVPIVHGMTIGEYALMINGEGWLEGGAECKVTVVPVLNWDHNKGYVLPIPPSPNLSTQESILLYPTLCLFEGTPLSVGRGTDRPFTMVGHPALPATGFWFTPQPKPGAAPKPLLQGQVCNGINFIDSLNSLVSSSRLRIDWLIDAYRQYPDKDKFFQPFFAKLAGTEELAAQIRAGKSADEIRANWMPHIKGFLQTREQYLLYPDSEFLVQLKK